MQRENEVQHVFLVGAKSLGAYGGVAVIIGTLKSSLFSSKYFPTQYPKIKNFSLSLTSTLHASKPKPPS